MGFSITIIIIVITTVFSMIAFSNRELFSRMLFNPYVIYESNQYYRFITYGLLHANWVHLLINMFVLYSFGDFVENAYIHFFPVLGRYYYILLYIFGLVLSVVPSYSKHKNDQWYASVGASGAVSAVIFSSIIINPFQGGIMIFPIPVTISPVLFGILYLIYSAYMSKKGKDNTGHDAHFWGAVFGIVFTIALRPAFVENFIRELSQIL